MEASKPKNLKIKGLETPVTGQIEDLVALANQLPDMEQAAINRNVIKASEFKKFAPLFNVEACGKLSKDERLKLSDELRRRLNLYRDITLIDDKRDEHGNVIVLKRFPPIMDEMRQMTDVFPQGATLVTMFMNSAGYDNPLSERAAIIGHYFRTAVQTLAKPTPEHEAATDKILEEFSKDASSMKKPDDEVDTDDFEWT